MDVERGPIIATIMPVPEEAFVKDMKPVDAAAPETRGVMAKTAVEPVHENGTMAKMALLYRVVKVKSWLPLTVTA